MSKSMSLGLFFGILERFPASVGLFRGIMKALLMLPLRGSFLSQSNSPKAPLAAMEVLLHCL